MMHNTLNDLKTITAGLAIILLLAGGCLLYSKDVHLSPGDLEQRMDTVGPGDTIWLHGGRYPVPVILDGLAGGSARYRSLRKRIRILLDTGLSV